MNLRCVLTWFQAVSGLRVNLAKSSILPIGHVDNIHMLAGVLGCKVEAFSTTYLSLPLGAKFKEKAIWDPIIENFEKRLWMEVYVPFKRGEINSHQECSLKYPDLLPLSFSLTFFGGQ